MNRTADEMLELARRVYPGKKIAVSNDKVLVSGIGQFSPKIDGYGLDKETALDCIVAAFKVKPSKQFNTELVYSPAGFSFLFCERMEGSVSKVGPEPDILQAAISALLGKDR